MAPIDRTATADDTTTASPGTPVSLRKTVSLRKRPKPTAPPHAPKPHAPRAKWRIIPQLNKRTTASAEQNDPRSLLHGEITVPAFLAAGTTPRRPLHPLLAVLLAAASGTALVAAFPPYGLWWLAPIAIAAFTLATAGQRVSFGLVLGGLHGAAFFTPLLSWTGLYVGPIWLLLPALQTLFLCLLGAAAAFTSRLPSPALPLITASLWVGQEALRSRLPFGGFPWGRIAFSQESSPLLHLARLGGAPLVTFAVALAGGCIAAAVLWPRGYPHLRLVYRTGALLGGAVLVVLSGVLTPLPVADGKTITVAVVQGNVPRLGLDFNAQRRAVLDNHVNATRELAERIDAGTVRRPNLVVWPENSSDIDPLTNADAGALIQEAADRIGVPILVGAVLNGPGPNVSNAGIVWEPRTGPGARYVKRHPVPFAEYMPMRGLARKLTDKVDLVRRDFKGGDEVGTLRLGPAVIGDVICFEVAYDELVRDTVDDGADMLVVQTNNATFGRSAESAQQLAMVRLRAVEHGRPAVMVSTSGVSATMDAGGRVLDRSGLFEAAVFVRDLRLSEGRTLATMLGRWPEALLALGGLAAVTTVAATRIRSRSTPRSASRRISRSISRFVSRVISRLISRARPRPTPTPLTPAPANNEAPLLKEDA